MINSNTDYSSPRKKTSENLILIEKTTNKVKDLKENFELTNNRKNGKRNSDTRMLKSQISRRSFSEISKSLMTFKDDMFSNTEQYETKLERMINSLIMTKNKLICYSDFSLADEISWYVNVNKC